MKDLINRLKDIRKSEPSTIKIERLNTLRKDISIIFYQTSIDADAGEMLMEMDEDIKQEIDRTTHVLDKAVEMRRTMF